MPSFSKMTPLRALSAGLTIASVAVAAPFGNGFRSTNHINATHRAAAAAGGCQPVSGTFSIENFKLYPENSDFDPIGCKLYAGSNFNATVLVYDPYTKESETITFPDISGVTPYHISGIDYDHTNRMFFFSANSGTPYESQGKDLSGPNKMIKYDPQAKKIVWTADMATFQQQYLTKFGRTVSGFQDQAEDAQGNCYVPLNFNGTGIAKIDPSGTVSAWYETASFPANSSSNPYNYVGVATILSSDKLIISETQAHTFLSFDTKSATPAPTTIKFTNMPATYAPACDALFTPTRYAGEQVLMCSDDFFDGTTGAMTVFTSKDNWATANYVGAILNNDPLANSSTPTAPVQIANSVFISEMFFFDTGVYDVPGDRASFPFIDITSQLDAMVATAGIQPVMA